MRKKPQRPQLLRLCGLLSHISRAVEETWMLVLRNGYTKFRYSVVLTNYNQMGFHLPGAEGQQD